MSKANEPVHPETCEGTQRHPGITKREYFAAKAVQGLLARTALDADQVAAYAIRIADALILELERKAEYAEQRASARLIAAAPEMLQALKELHEYGGCGHETPGVHGCFCDIITKAEGKE